MKYRKLNLRQARKEWKKGVNIYLYPVYGKDTEPVGGMEISIFTSSLKDDSFDGFVTYYKSLSRQKMNFFVEQ